MATLYSAQLSPTKIELLSRWVPTQAWASGVDTSALESVGAFRFDDPDGEVGVETHLLGTPDGRVLQVPLTYRAHALEGAEGSFITTMQHSVLGERWVYDASADPVYARALAVTILLGGEQAEMNYVTDHGFETRPSPTQVRGSGSSSADVPQVEHVSFVHEGDVTVIDARELELRVRRVVVPAHDGGATDDASLVGRWPGHDEWTLLSTAHSSVRR
jgi:hypothetical protein